MPPTGSQFELLLQCCMYVIAVGQQKTGTFLGTYEVPKGTDGKALGVMWLSFHDDANENIISILAQNF